jgi:hypothetical protein
MRYGLDGPPAPLLTPPPSSHATSSSNPTRKLHKKVVQAITSATQEFRSDLDSLARANSKLNDLAEQCKVFGESLTDYPKGTKPFASQSSNVHLDAPWSVAENSGGHTFHVLIPYGSTRREAGALIHRAWSKTWKNMELEAHHDFIAELQRRCDYNVLEDTIKQTVHDPAKPDLAAKFGLAAPPPQYNDDDVRAFVHKKYTQLYFDFE